MKFYFPLQIENINYNQLKLLSKDIGNPSANNIGEIEGQGKLLRFNYPKELNNAGTILKYHLKYSNQFKRGDQCHCMVCWGVMLFGIFHFQQQFTCTKNDKTNTPHKTNTLLNNWVSKLSFKVNITVKSFLNF